MYIVFCVYENKHLLILILKYCLKSSKSSPSKPFIETKHTTEWMKKRTCYIDHYACSTKKRLLQVLKQMCVLIVVTLWTQSE